MKRQILIKAIVGIYLLGVTAHLLADTSETPVVIDSIQANGNQIALGWSGGRANYQLQTAAAPSGLWVNIGAPTSNYNATISITNGQAYFRVASDFTAQYQVVFNATWSQQTLPTNWPSTAHFSGLAGGTHNFNVHFWRDGETASEGIRRVAELGQPATLLGEVASAMTNGTALFQLSGGGINPSPGSVSLTFPQLMTRNFPLVSLVSMIAPSPDWFVGVDSLNLIESDGQWATNKSVTLYGRDAGTDSGVTFTSPDQVTVPRGVVMPFTGFPAIQDGTIVPFGTFTFTRLD